MYKIQTNVPKKDIDKVRLAMWDAGAWIIGNYSHCAFIMPWIWYFLAMDGASPVIGNIWIPETVEEYRLEMVCEKKKIKDVIKALKESHPYEEPPIEIIKLESLESL